MVLAAAVVAAGMLFAVYRAAGLRETGPLLPLDDVYIHFRYAESIAQGMPYQYNPGGLPTSGATSLLYPYLLAPGVLLGFSGLLLAHWAMALGAAAYAFSAVFVFHIAYAAAVLFSDDAPVPIRVLAGRIIAARVSAAPTSPVRLSGGRVIPAHLGAARTGAAVLGMAMFLLYPPFHWHFMSGMETGLVVCAALAVAWALLTDRPRALIAAAAAFALLRPEGAVAVLVVVGLRVLAWVRPAGQARPRRTEWVFSIVAVLAIGVQPVLNALITGSFSASGSAAKSVFSMWPPDPAAIAARIGGHLVGAVRDLAGLGDGAFSTPVLFVLAAIGAAALVRGGRPPRAARQRAVVGLFALMLGLLGLIATLDTAFWHFRRYQMPVYALLLVLAIVGTSALVVWAGRVRTGRAFRWLMRAAVCGLAAIAVGFPGGAGEFLLRYRLNVRYVEAQPLAMARWLAANAPADARVAVHDVGMMRFQGRRETLDMVGLTTPGAATSWRAGPGAVGEWLQRQRPSLIASYGEGHGYGLGYLADTDLYADVLAEYTVMLDPARNVALAAETQVIARPAWETSSTGERPPLIAALFGLPADATATTTVDVADLASEAAAGYAAEWRPGAPALGFPTEFFQFPAVGCPPGAGCTAADGSRRIAQGERFTVAAQPGSALLVFTRVHAERAGAFAVYADDARVAGHTLPALPGGWLDVPTLIPGDRVTAERVQLRIVPDAADGMYQPAHHWAFADADQWLNPIPTGSPAVTFFDGAAALFAPTLTQPAPDTLALTVTWAGVRPDDLAGDWTVFVHLLSEDGTLVRQIDRRPGYGGLVVANWIAASFTETYTFDRAGLSGPLTLALGLYDAASGVRAVPAAGADRPPGLTIDSLQSRVILGIVGS